MTTKKPTEAAEPAPPETEAAEPDPEGFFAEKDAEPAEPATAKLGAKVGLLGLPPSFSLREDIAFAATVNSRRAWAAALGVCWRGSPRIHVSIEACGYNVQEYGGKVIDYLLGKSVPRAQITEAGGAAWTLIAASIMDGGEVSKQEGFFESETKEESAQTT